MKQLTAEQIEDVKAARKMLADPAASNVADVSVELSVTCDHGEDGDADPECPACELWKLASDTADLLEKLKDRIDHHLERGAAK